METNNIQIQPKQSIITRWQSWAPYFLSVLRIVAAIIFITVGTIKLFAYPIGMPPNGAAVTNWLSLIGIAGMLEVFGGALMLLGLFTRPVAFILAGEMAVAYFIGHASGGFWPVVNGGIDAVLYCFLFLYFSAAGAGPWSIDAKRKKVQVY
ncbi:MAG TPA: DoxX family protein [Candidatus Paceibacterota bacterium]|nr:DoxX family protein [Candidatus Paceibacterota bacterium]